MADPREDDAGTGVIVLDNPDDPVPQPIILGPEGQIYSPDDFDADGNLKQVDDLTEAYEANAGTVDDDEDQ